MTAYEKLNCKDKRQYNVNFKVSKHELDEIDKLCDELNCSRVAVLRKSVEHMAGRKIFRENLHD